MTPNNWEQLNPLFGKALEMPAAERAGYVAEILGRDEQLGRQLESLMRAHQRKTFFAGEPTAHLGALAPQDVPVFSPGELVLGRFTVIRLVGSGGMGSVYEAKDNQLGRIALKTIRPDLAADPQMLSRFRHEVELARRISSYHVCRIHELFTLPAHGRSPASALLTMEFLDGITVSGRIRARGPIPWREAETIAEQICRGLAAVHEGGVVHRDLKSGNIMLSTRQGKPRAVLMDFGLAQEVFTAADEGASTMTLSEGVAGTFEYMAPEQFEDGRLSAATDIYALGVVLYEMVTAKRPFEAGTPLATAVRRAKRPVAASALQAGLPRRWDEVIHRCLEYEPERRFQSAHEVGQALAGQTTARDIRRLVGTASRSYRTTLALLGLILILSGAVVWKSFHRYYTPPKAALDWYAKGLEAFREGTFLKAAELFQSALTVDKNFALAHARLADAWNELDFKGKADEEMVAVSSEQESGLRPGERSYCEAVRAVLRRDFQPAIQEFRKLLNELPADEKAAGYVDLGRTYEKKGDIAAALGAYGEAKKRALDSPTAFLRSAALESRQGLDAAAATDFEQASRLYTKLGSPEGAAEVAYQRSYWQSILHHFKEAREQAQKSLDAARSLPVPSVQLEVRALCRFSAIDHGGNNDGQAILDASKAIALAHENGLEYWENDALIRQGAGYLGNHDFPSARNCFDKALDAAGRNHWPRLVALAQVNLAALRDQQGQAQDLPGLAIAMDYYKVYQFPSESLNPLLFLVRGENNLSQYESALPSGLEVVSVARKLANRIAVALAEEAVGTAYLGLQQYPDALKHFDAALDEANRAGDAEAAHYDLAHRADALRRLGRFEESEDALHALADKGLAALPNCIRTHILLSQGKYREAVQLARSTLASYRNLDFFAAEDLRIAGSMAATQAGLPDQAQSWSAEALSVAQKNGDDEMAADARLAQALMNLRAHAPRAAKASAEEALTFFEAHSQKESEWLGLFYLAQSEKALANSASAKQDASKALDIVSAFEHNWETSAFRSYEKRPDVAAARRELQRMVGP